MNKLPAIRKGQIWGRKVPFLERHDYVRILNYAHVVDFLIVGYTADNPSIDYAKMINIYEDTYHGFILKYELTPFRISDLGGLRLLLPNFKLEREHE